MTGDEQSNAPEGFSERRLRGVPDESSTPFASLFRTACPDPQPATSGEFTLDMLLAAMNKVANAPYPEPGPLMPAHPLDAPLLRRYQQTGDPKFTHWYVTGQVLPEHVSIDDFARTLLNLPAEESL